MRIIPEAFHVSRHGLFIRPWSVTTAAHTLKLIRQYPENARTIHGEYVSYRFGCLVFSRRKKEKVSVRLVTDVQLDVEAIQEYLAGGGVLYLYDESETARIACEGKRGKKVRYDVACRYAAVADVQIFQTGYDEREVYWRGA